MFGQTFETNWIPGESVKGSKELVLKTLVYHLMRFAPKKFLYKRTPESVKSSYNELRLKLLQTLESTSWDDFIFFPESQRDFYLKSDKIVYGPLREPRTLLLERIKSAVASNAKPGGVVVEIGSGDGRNLLYLKSQFPDLKFVGYELSDVSVELSKAAAKKFSVVDVEFYATDATKPLPPFKAQGEVLLCYSSFALEMMPRIFRGAVDNMIQLNPNHITFFEPIGELWSLDLRGLASRLRVLNLDRLRGLFTCLEEIEKGGKWKIQSAHRSKVGINPFNEMVEIHLENKLPQIN